MEVPVRVVARVKPSMPEDVNERCVQVAPTASQIILGFDNFCDFDAVFGEDVPQKELYNTCLVDMVANFFQGFNTTVLSYGQQGSGKTYTMTGPDFLWAMNEDEFGLLPQAIRHIFKMMNEVPEREYRVHISYLIIHQEAVYDLLSSRQPLSPLNVLEDSVGNVVIPGLTVVDCSNITEVFNCLEAGLLQRHSASTLGFDVTSAHTMFSLTLEHQWADPEGRMNYLYSRINFVDLAGIEDTFALNYNDIGSLPSSIKNNFFINTDLKAFTNVVQCLVNKSYRGLIPYRDSRLTHILKDSLGGNSITLMVCCVSPLNKDYDASHNTLKLGSLTRYVTNFPTPNLVLQNSMQSLTSPNMPSNITSVWSSRPSTHTGHLSSTPVSQSITVRSLNIPQQQGFPSQSYPNYQPPMVNGMSPGLGSVEELPPHENDEVFKVQFAASQWHILVSSAEDLLAEILQTGNVSPADRSRIQSWLCMKAEADECIGNDLPPLQTETEGSRPLEVIEELSEPNDVMDGSVASRKSESEVSSSGSSLGEEFYDHLETLREKFFTLTSDLVREAENQYLTRDKFWEDSSPRKSVDEGRDKRENSGESPSREQANVVHAEVMSVSEDSSASSLSETGKNMEGTRESEIESEESSREKERENVPYNTPKRESFHLPPVVAKEEPLDPAFGDRGAEDENLEGESDKENLAYNFGSRLSLISKTSSVSSAESKIKKKVRGQKRSERMVERFKRMSSLGRSSHQDPRPNGNSAAAVAEDSCSSSAADIYAFSREMEESLEVDEEEGLGASSEKELIRRVSSKLVSVSKGPSKCVNSLKSKSCQLKRSIRSHIFKRRNKVNKFSIDGAVETNKNSHSTDVPCSVRRVSDELKVAKERLEELKATIKVKEAFIQELRISDTEAETTRKKCKLQMEQLEEELNDVTKMHHKAQNKMMEAHGDEDEKVHYRNKIYEYSRKMNHLRKKMASLDKVASISQHNDVKVKQLEKSIHELREEQEELHTKLREEMQWKEQLEQQILREHRCARNPLCSSSKLIDEDSDREVDIETSDKPFTVDSDNILLPTDKNAVDKKKGTSKKRKLANSTGDSQSEKSLRGDSRIGFKEKSKSGPEFSFRETDSHSPDFIRKEIDLIRVARDNLVAKRQKIDKRIRKGRSKGDGREEERKLLEYDEAVEGLDSVIERKNEILTGKATQVLPFSPLLTKNDLEERFKNLPVPELQFLLVKYFTRVIDLRIEFRRQELAFAELENQFDEQNRYISNLKAAYQQASLEMERRLTSLQREYQYKISYLLRQFNDDSAGHGVQEMKLYEMEQHLYYYKKLSRELKDKLKEYLNQNQSRQIREFESIPGPSEIKNHRSDCDPMRTFLPHRSDPSTPMTPQVWPRRGRRFAMPSIGGSNTTKVTRQKNKLIIQQNGEGKPNS